MPLNLALDAIGAQRMEEPENCEPYFGKEVVRLINYFNLIELNVGLCISFLKNPESPSAVYPALSRMSVEKKIDWLKDLLGSGVFDDRTEALIEFNRWYERTTGARAIRNRFIHARWEYLGSHLDQPIEVASPAWMREKLGGEVTERLSFRELRVIVNDVASIFGELMHLRTKYGV